MHDLLERTGFLKIHECICAGTLTEAWQHPKLVGVLVEIKPNRGSFELWGRERTHLRGREEEFGKAIAELFPQEMSEPVHEVSVKPFVPSSKRNPKKVQLPPKRRRCCGKGR